MSSIINAPKQIRFYAAAIALAALAITLLAVSFATGPAQAQNSGNLATYPDPQPCGPGANTAFMEEPHEVRTGHYALFDAYWRITSFGLGDDAAGTGVLYMNECPPEMVKKKQGRAIVATRTASGIDIEEAIIHVLDKHKEDVVATNAEATAGQLSLDEYPAVRKGLDPEDDDPEVWWLRLDDPDTVDDPNTPKTENDETSDLGIGFSTALLDSKYWLTSAEGKPMRYKFEVESYPADPDNSGDVPHFFTYKAPKANGAAAVLVWDGFSPGVEARDMELDPGEYEALQWVFTKPGTYELLVEFQGYVRRDNPYSQVDPEYANWKPISSNVTETRTAKYTFHVGPKLKETEPPIFGVNLSVAENSPGGVKVGGPVPVYNADAEVLYYDLDGEGEENFETVVASTDPHAVQIVVAEGASLDFETRPSYDLQLTVTDKLNHEGDEDSPEPVIDDTLIVRISLEDQEPGVDLQVDQAYPAVGERVNFIARYEPTTEQRGQTFSYQWEKAIGGNRWHVFDLGTAPSAPTWSVAQSSAGAETYRATVVLPNDDTSSQLPTFVNSEDIRVTWEN